MGFYVSWLKLQFTKILFWINNEQKCIQANTHFVWKKRLALKG